MNVLTLAANLPDAWFPNDDEHSLRERARKLLKKVSAPPPAPMKKQPIVIDIDDSDDEDKIVQLVAPPPTPSTTISPTNQPSPLTILVPSFSKRPREEENRPEEGPPELSNTSLYAKQLAKRGRFTTDSR